MRNFKFCRVAGVVGAVMLLAACSSGTGGAAESCGMVQPCGGALTGTWTLRASCGSIANFIDDDSCTGATLDESMVATTGSIVFNADMTVTFNITETGTRKVKAPLSCLQVASCDEYASLFVPAAPIAATTCTAADNACDCAQVYATPMNNATTGTYSVAGNVVRLTSPGGSTDEVSYCVQGNTLHLVSGTSAGFVATR